MKYARGLALREGPYVHVRRSRRRRCPTISLVGFAGCVWWHEAKLFRHCRQVPFPR